MNWPLSKIGLRVQDLESEVKFYLKLGFVEVRDQRDDGIVGMGVGDTELLTLRELKGGKARPAHSAGMYHFAILLPSEEDLGSFLHHSLENIGLEGASDHLVSQALYLHDPEGNGIEVYADRPRGLWQWEDREIQMASIRPDLEALLAKAKPFTKFPEETLLGHVHLNVGNLADSEQFYQTLGMDVVADIPFQAKFMSWDLYHHHIGMNTWEGAGATPVDDNSYGIDFFQIRRGDTDEELIYDPNHIRIEIIN